MPLRSRRQATQRGFTLIELLVALSIMAVMAVLSWRGLDGMTRTQTQVRQHSDEVLTLQAALAQWGADLDALARQPGIPTLDWDGRALRVVRRSASQAGEGLMVVAWSRRSMSGVGQWLRWQSPPVTTRGELQLAWQKAAQWGQTPVTRTACGRCKSCPWTSGRFFTTGAALGATRCPVTALAMPLPPVERLPAHPQSVGRWPCRTACAWCCNCRPGRRSAAP